MLKKRERERRGLWTGQRWLTGLDLLAAPMNHHIYIAYLCRIPPSAALYWWWERKTTTLVKLKVKQRKQEIEMRGLPPSQQVGCESIVQPPPPQYIPPSWSLVETVEHRWPQRPPSSVYIDFYGRRWVNRYCQKKKRERKTGDYDS